jgi:hypothetical protein
MSNFELLYNQFAVMFCRWQWQLGMLKAMVGFDLPLESWNSLKALFRSPFSLFSQVILCDFWI